MTRVTMLSMGAIRRFCLMCVAFLSLARFCLSRPAISLSPSAGPPTTKLFVSGNGFSAYAAIDIYFDTSDEALVVTNGQGEFDYAKIHVPRSAYPRQHWVTALERSHANGAQKPFLVQTNWREFHFDADGARVNPYENVLNPRTVTGLDLKWRYPTDHYVEEVPYIANGVVYVGGDRVHALNASTGAKLWSYTTGFLMGSSAVAYGAVYVGSNDYNVYALNASTGDKLWSYATGYYVQSSPAVTNGVVYVGSGDGNVYALYAFTGAKLWSYFTGGSVFSSPAVVNGVVYVGSSSNNVYALNARTGRLLWSYRTGFLVGSSPAVANGVVYVGSYDGNVYALNARTGIKLWSYSIGSFVFSSPAVADGVVYIGSVSGALWALNASTGVLLWNYFAGNHVNSSPAVANGVIYVGSDDNNVYALCASTGELLWSYATGGSVVSSPTVANGMVYVGSDDGRVYAFGQTNSAGATQVSGRPDLTTLRPNFNLKPSVPVRKLSGSDD